MPTCLSSGRVPDSIGRVGDRGISQDGKGLKIATPLASMS
jgi:hypothetical protein